MTMSNANKINGVLAALKLAGIENPEIKGMGGNLQAIVINLGERNHAMLCDYATESGNWAALLMSEDDEHPIRIDEATPMNSIARWQMLVAAFRLAQRVVRSTEFGSECAISANVAAFDLAREFGWDNLEDDDWMEWCLKATESEILEEGLSRALEHCRIGRKEP